MEENSLDILKRYNLSITKARVRILDLLQKKHSGMAHHDIEKEMHVGFDRTTIYRTLQVFVEKGIIHTIPTPDNSIQYALCKGSCTEGHHLDNHAHFSCESCGKVYCLDSVVVPAVKLPKGFLVKQKDLVMNGICSSCKK